MPDTAIARGRPARAALYAGPIREAERRIADRLPALVDGMLALASERVPEQCEDCKRTMCCPDCGQLSRGMPANQSALTYLINRIAGTPAPAGEQRVDMDMVNRIAKHVATAFREVNALETPEERSAQFAMRVAELFALAGAEGG